MSSTATSPNYWKFNLYDVFSNFLPGAYLLLGIALPFAPPSLELGGVTVLHLLISLILAFILGSAIQALAADLYGRKTAFERRMDRIQNGDAAHEGESVINQHFVALCDSELKIKNLTNENQRFKNWGWLFKLLLSDLEDSSKNRTLRLQALHLSARGLSLSSFLLALYYIPFLIPEINSLSNFSYLFLVPMIVLSLVLGEVFRGRSKHFEDDVSQYLISEFVLKYRDELN
ncbi:hypothetical protein [Salinigranum rubrum]|uniref:hypothetical protein n=1 Tax=Salinigranum rubrum TaxID=755307 RepID=UPI0013A5401B|nr:hypothetical protein [Salinigranum rubrum]